MEDKTKEDKMEDKTKEELLRAKRAGVIIGVTFAVSMCGLLLFFAYMIGISL